MEALRIQRRIGRTEAARESGAGYGLPRITSDQAQIALTLASLATLPTVVVPSPVVTDPGSPYFGKRKFILGISEIGGDDVMV